jgi:transposase
MLRTVEFKLYPKPAQEETLNRWLRVCCWIHNRALEQKKKAYKRAAL